MEQQFEARLDDLSKIITYVTFAVLLVPLVLLANLARQGHPEVLIPLALAFVGLGVAAWFRVRSYTLTADRLLIHRPAGIKAFGRKDFASATPVTPKELGFGLRLLGSGGFFGYFGNFVYRHAGKASVYATDRAKLILLRTREGRQIIVSPADTQGFLKALKLPQAAVVAA